MTPREIFRQLMAGKRSRSLYDIIPTQPVEVMMQRHLKRDGLYGPGVFTPFIRVQPSYPVEPEAWTHAYAEIGYSVPEHSRFAPFGLLFGGQGNPANSASAHLESFLHPLANVVDLQQVVSLPWPDLDDPALYAHLKSDVAKIHDSGLIAVGKMDCTVFEHTWYLRSMEQLFFDWMEEDPIADWLLDWFTRRSIKAVEAFVDASVDIIFLGDDIGTQQSLLLSVAMWRQHLKPRLKAVIDASRRGDFRPPWIAYHSDGAISPLLPDLIEAGVQILNPIQPECMNLDHLFSQFHGQLAFWGGVGTQTTLPFCSASEVRESVANLLQLAEAHGARLIPAPTHYLEPDVPIANIMAFLEVVRA